jgi:hypothetical protein
LFLPFDGDFIGLGDGQPEESVYSPALAKGFGSTSCRWRTDVEAIWKFVKVRGAAVLAAFFVHF